MVQNNLYVFSSLNETAQRRLWHEAEVTKTISCSSNFLTGTADVLRIVFLATITHNAAPVQRTL